jgi:hypothetical protein
VARLDETAAGVFIIAVTPFREDGALDVASTDRVVEFYLDRGATGLTILGLMGEAPKLSGAEAVASSRHLVWRVAGRVPVLAGASSPRFAAMRDLAVAVVDDGVAEVRVAPPGSVRADDAFFFYSGRASPDHLRSTTGTVRLDDGDLGPGSQSAPDITEKPDGVVFEAGHARDRLGGNAQGSQFSVGGDEPPEMQYSVLDDDISFRLETPGELLELRQDEIADAAVTQSALGIIGLHRHQCLHKIGATHDTDHPPVDNDRDAADSPGLEQVGDLTERGSGSNSDHVGGHDVAGGTAVCLDVILSFSARGKHLEPAPASLVGAEFGPAIEVAVSDDAHEPPGFIDNR